MDDLVSTVLQQLGAVNQAASSYKAQMAQGLQQASDLGNQVVSAVQGGTDSRGDTPLSIQTRMLGQLQAQQDANKAGAAAGTNMKDNTQIMTDLASQLQSATAEAVRANQVVQQKQSVGMMDNPVEYFLNQLSLPDDMKYAQAATATANSVSARITALTNATDQITTTQRALAETMDAASIDSMVSGVQNNINAQALAAKQQNILHNVQGVQTLYNMDADTMKNTMGAASLMISEKHLELARENAAREQVNADLQRQNLQMMIDQKQLDMAGRQDAINKVNAGLTKLGYAPMDGLKIMSGLNNKDPLLSIAYNEGAVYQATGLKTLGDGSAGSVASTLIRTNAPLTDAMKPTANLVTGVYRDVAAKAAASGGRFVSSSGQEFIIDPKDPSTLNAAVTSEVRAQSSQWMKNSNVGDPSTNPYSLPPIASIFKPIMGQDGKPMLNAAAQNPVLQKYVQPLVDSGAVKSNDPEFVINAVASQIGKGVTFEQARDAIMTYAATAAKINDAIRQNTFFGLPEQRIVGVQFPGQFYGKNSYDLSSANDVGRLLATRSPQAAVVQLNSLASKLQNVYTPKALQFGSK